MTSGAARPLEILVVEDNAADVVFFSEAAAATGISVAMHVVDDGDDALRFLRREADFSDARRPDVIVLDLNLPVKPGEEVLREMAADPELSTIPVAILTSSSRERHLCDGYPAGRSRYYIKTADLKQLQEIVRQIVAFARRADGAAT